MDHRIDPKEIPLIDPKEITKERNDGLTNLYHKSSITTERIYIKVGLHFLYFNVLYFGFATAQNRNNAGPRHSKLI